MHALRLAALLLLLPMLGSAQDRGLQNWFDDPFLRLSADVADCPSPLGPYTTESGRRDQAHHRAERGASCYLAGGCDQPSSYAYDQEIAARVREALERSGELRGTSLWLTVQGRVVFIEGCVRAVGAGPRLERLARAVPRVQQAVAIVYVRGSGKPPYRVAPPR